ncbi:MAG: hypothetical protein HYW15_01330 [Candidatus Giovannonibacteria bacterium]|nr:MAG: hypothetical protein HYW15_01330 [Candidatus Giovannonibacteria bacterium]
MNKTLDEVKALLAEGFKLTNEVTEKRVALAKKSIRGELSEEERERLEAEIKALEEKINDIPRRMRALH